MSVMVVQVWRQWSSYPVMLSLSNGIVKAWMIPFPSVTICPQNKYKKSVFNVQEIVKKDVSSLKNQTKKMLGSMLLVCRDYKFNHSSFPFIAEPNPVKVIKKVAPSLNETVTCWHPFNKPCLDAFQTLMTPEGVCFSYNLLPNLTFLNPSMFQDTQDRKTTTHIVWSLYDKYFGNSTVEDLPVRGIGIGFRNRRTFLLTTDNNDIDKYCRIGEGFKIALTNPADVPQINHRFYTVPIKGLTVMAVEPVLMSTSKTLSSLNPQVRGCYFPQEKHLAYFSTFTQGNCNYECLTNITLRICGCVEFYMPRNKTTPVCGVRAKKCLRGIKEYVSSQLKTLKSKQELINLENDCSCMTECQSVEYNAEISQGIVDLGGLDKNFGIDKMRSNRNISRSILMIYLKDFEVLAVRRSSYYGIEDFIANCGGLLSLCCGFSVLSIAELVYYFTLRLYSNTRQPGTPVAPVGPVVQMMPTVTS